MSDSIVLGILVHDGYISMLATCKCCGTFQESINLLEENAWWKKIDVISWKVQQRCFEQLKYFLSSKYVCPDCLFISWSCSSWEPCCRKELSICACCRAVDNLRRRGVSDGERYVCDLSNSSTDSWWNLHFCCHLHSSKKAFILTNIRG